MGLARRVHYALSFKASASFRSDHLLLVLCTSFAPGCSSLPLACSDCILFTFEPHPAQSQNMEGKIVDYNDPNWRKGFCLV